MLPRFGISERSVHGVRRGKSGSLVIGAHDQPIRVKDLRFRTAAKLGKHDNCLNESKRKRKDFVRDTLTAQSIHRKLSSITNTTQGGDRKAYKQDLVLARYFWFQPDIFSVSQIVSVLARYFYCQPDIFTASQLFSVLGPYQPDISSISQIFSVLDIFSDRQIFSVLDRYFQCQPDIFSVGPVLARYFQYYSDIFSVSQIFSMLSRHFQCQPDISSVSQIFPVNQPDISSISQIFSVLE